MIRAVLRTEGAEPASTEDQRAPWLEEVKRGAERDGEKTYTCGRAAGRTSEEAHLDAQPARKSHQLKGHSLEKIIFATSLPSPEICVLVVTQNYFPSVVVTPAFFPEGHKVPPYESPFDVCHTVLASPAHILKSMYVTVTSEARLALLLSKMTLSLLSLYSQRFKPQITKKFRN